MLDLSTAALASDAPCRAHFICSPARGRYRLVIIFLNHYAMDLTAAAGLPLSSCTTQSHAQIGSRTSDGGALSALHVATTNQARLKPAVIQCISPFRMHSFNCPSKRGSCVLSAALPVADSPGSSPLLKLICEGGVSSPNLQGLTFLSPEYEEHAMAKA